MGMCGEEGTAEIMTWMLAESTLDTPVGIQRPQDQRGRRACGRRGCERPGAVRAWVPKRSDPLNERVVVESLGTGESHCSQKSLEAAITRARAKQVSEVQTAEQSRRKRRKREVFRRRDVRGLARTASIGA